MSDFDRPLNKRGRKAAPFIGELMLEKGFIPDYILGSPAQRAKETTAMVAAALGIDSEIPLDQRIYEASINSLLHIVFEFNDNFGSAMIVGHNPGFEGLVQMLTGNYERMPTAALAVIDLSIDRWNETESGNGNLVDILRPKEQKALRERG